jgi:hypothetical protein
MPVRFLTGWTSLILHQEDEIIQALVPQPCPRWRILFLFHQGKRKRGRISVVLIISIVEEHTQ